MTPKTPPETQAPPPLRSSCTEGFSRLLEQLEISLLVTTYQAGKLVVVRADDGQLNTHFRGFHKPMGLALDASNPDRLAIGTALEIWEFHNLPAVARKLEPAGKHDARYLPRRGHTTGDVQIHEMAWADGELWFVNTRFSCLCTLDAVHSFVPRWRPPFISALAPEDRCHLNGLALDGGRVAYATALGSSDRASGWRRHKRDGGVLLEVHGGEVVAGGLSMPHSPRCHGGWLWLLESGNGGVGFVEANGRLETVARLPGFTRGLDFHGRFAFIGLSQVRESAVFSGIAIAERPQAERCCGVWVLDCITGRIVAFLRFEDAVQEIFAVQVLPRRFPDLINDNPAPIADSFVLPDESLADVPQPLLCAV